MCSIFDAGENTVFPILPENLLGDRCDYDRLFMICTVIIIYAPEYQGATG